MENPVYLVKREHLINSLNYTQNLCVTNKLPANQQNKYQFV